MVVPLTSLIHEPRFDPGEVRPREDGWGFGQLAGRLVQLEGAGDSAALTLAFSAILEAQLCGEPAAWIAVGASTFYPPDAHDNGIDLAALPVVRVADVTAAFSTADLLLRSGGFGLLVADLGVPPAVPSTFLARLAGLARRHQSALLFLTRSAPASPPVGTSRLELHDGRPPIGRQDAPASPLVGTSRRDAPASPPVGTSRLELHDGRPPVGRQDAPASEGSLGSLISMHARAERRRQSRDRFRCGLVAVKDKQRGPAWRHMEVRHGATGLR